MMPTTQETKDFRKTLNAVSAAESVEWINMLVYGEPGVGKTFFCGTADDHKDTSPVLLLDVEGGTLTLRKRAKIDVAPVRSQKDVVEIHNQLKANPGYYKTVVIDSLSELQKLDMRDIMVDAVRKRPDQDIDVPSQREWGKSIEHIRKIVRAFRDLPCNTIMTALAYSDKDGESNAMVYTPNLPGKLKVEVPGFLDIVGYYFTAVENDQVIRRMQFQKTRRVVAAKDRTDSLGSKIDDPTIPQLWSLIHGGNNGNG
jgi:phage nucleotide-binding protein